MLVTKLLVTNNPHILFKVILEELSLYGIWETVVELFQFSVCMHKFLNLNILFPYTTSVSI